MKNRLPTLLFSAHSMDFYTPRRTRPELHLVEPSRLWVGLQAAREVRDGREQNERKNKIGKNSIDHWGLLHKTLQTRVLTWLNGANL